MFVHVWLIVPVSIWYDYGCIGGNDDWQQHGIRVNGLWPYILLKTVRIYIYQAYTEKLLKNVRLGCLAVLIEAGLENG